MPTFVETFACRNAVDHAALGCLGEPAEVIEAALIGLYDATADVIIAEGLCEEQAIQLASRFVMAVLDRIEEFSRATSPASQ
jgi:hypothetical protein